MGSCIQSEAEVETLSNVAVSATCFSCIGRSNIGSASCN